MYIDLICSKYISRQLWKDSTFTDMLADIAHVNCHLKTYHVCTDDKVVHQAVYCYLYPSESPKCIDGVICMVINKPHAGIELSIRMS